jgi:hypothetical protein
MRYLVISVTLIIYLVGCSTSQKNGNNESEVLIESEEFIDSTKLIATLKRLDYSRYTEGNLVDKRSEENIDPKDSVYQKYPNPFSPPLSLPVYFENIKADTLKVYFCNYYESSCVKIEDRYFEEGAYRLKFQKLDFKKGYYTINIYGSDGFLAKRVIIVH